MTVAEDILAHRTTEVADLCRRTGVLRLEIFGSATTESSDPNRSDLDFLYEFEDYTSPTLPDQFFNLWEGLEALFGRKIDLVSARRIKNPHFLQELNTQRRVIYAA